MLVSALAVLTEGAALGRIRIVSTPFLRLCFSDLTILCFYETVGFPSSPGSSPSVLLLSSGRPLRRRGRGRGRDPSDHENRSFFQSCGSVWPTSLTYIGSEHKRLFTLETRCGDGYDRERGWPFAATIFKVRSNALRTPENPSLSGSIPFDGARGRSGAGDRRRTPGARSRGIRFSERIVSSHPRSASRPSGRRVLPSNVEKRGELFPKVSATSRRRSRVASVDAPLVPVRES